MFLMINDSQTIVLNVKFNLLIANNNHKETLIQNVKQHFY